MSSRVRHPPDVRAWAIAALLVGERPAVVARELGIPEATVRTWRHRLKNGNFETLKKGGGAFGELLLEHLEASLRSLIAQSEHFSDPEAWREIPAGELAIIMGTNFDRTWRMLELVPALLGDVMEGRGAFFVVIAAR